LAVRDRLLFTRTALSQQKLFRVVTLLIDTGASQTIISWETLLSLNIDPSSSTPRKQVTTANGTVWMPQVEIEEFNALGQSVGSLRVLAHTIPLGSQVNGVLGMDFLRQFEFRLNFKQSVIEL
ncbi:MAG TPA: retropepsin-like aspartic protease, partial [Blastocatellia bacterium]|nr:retropepsin-like aspartic protease [Blastocatellia bacterium]